MYEKLKIVGADVPWRKTYEYEAFDEPYWVAHNYSCGRVIINLIYIKKEFHYLDIE